MNAKEWLTTNALKIVGVQALVIAGLLWVSFSGPGGDEEVRVERDTTVEVRTDTLWRTRVDTFWRENPQPDSTLQEASADTVYQDSLVYISNTPPLQRYRQTYTGQYYHAVVTSRVRGELIRQRAQVQVSLPEIQTTVNTTIDTRTTRIRDPWEITLGGMVGGNTGHLSSLAPGIGLRTPAGLTVQYHYNLLSEDHLVSLHRSILTR